MKNKLHHTELPPTFRNSLRLRVSINTKTVLSFQAVVGMNSNDQHCGAPAAAPMQKHQSHGYLQGNIFDLDVVRDNLHNHLDRDQSSWTHRTTPERTVLSNPEPNGKQSRSPPRCLSRCGKQHSKGSQSEKRDTTSYAVPSKEVRAKTGFDVSQQDWKIPFVGQDPVSGKVYFIDTSPNATNFNANILCKRHLWYQCPFNPYHLIKTSKKFVTHIQRCIHQSHLGYNGKQSEKEVKNWLVCEFNSKHRVHKDYMITHFLQNCDEVRMDLTAAWYQNKRVIPEV